MVLKSDKLRLKQMLSDSITVLCRAGLPFQSKVKVEALIGITLDDSEVVLVNFKETMTYDGNILPSDEEDENNEEDVVPCSDMAINFQTSSENRNKRFNNTERRSNNARRRRRDMEEVDETPSATVNFNAISSEHWEPEARLNCKSLVDPNCKYESGGDNFWPKPEPGLLAYDYETDDCVIVKTEEQQTYCDDGQQWGQIESFTENNLDNLQQTNPIPERRGSVRRPPGMTPRKPRPPWKRELSYNLNRVKSSQQKASPGATDKATENTMGTDVMGRQVLQCVYCDAVFNKTHVLKEHVNGVHFKKRMFRCSNCGESFKWRADLSKHRRVPGLCPCSGLMTQD